MITDTDFKMEGFLSQSTQDGIDAARARNADWFKLAEDTNRVLMGLVETAIANPAARGSNWSKEAVAVALLMRSSGSFQGAVLMAERGMVVQARTLVRSIVEDAFVAGALTTKPDEVIKMLREGAEASRKSQTKFIVAQKLGDSEEVRRQLEAVIDTMERGLRFLRPKTMAGLSSLLPQYLDYMRLSEDSAHPSAKSLNKHIKLNPDRSGWSYTMEPATREDVEPTLYRAVLSVLSVSIVVNELVPDAAGDKALKEVLERFQQLPTGAVI